MRVLPVQVTSLGLVGCHAKSLMPSSCWLTEHRSSFCTSHIQATVGMLSLRVTRYLPSPLQLTLPAQQQVCKVSLTQRSAQPTVTTPLQPGESEWGRTQCHMRGGRQAALTNANFGVGLVHRDLLRRQLQGELADFKARFDGAGA